ncbi:MAG: enoyl-CoA hydratase-related protein [Syntrophomonadaceae bacterium]|nr:enoyl-CoA hydratase-related protein [Syntrophomonadaceae bacterium]
MKKEFETVIYEKNDGIAIIKFNRPESLNAISPELLRDTRAALADAKADDSIRAIIFTGEGDRSFIAGGDIKLMEKMSTMEFKDFCMEIQKVTTDVREVRKPVIGAINGWAMGGGAEVASICDWRICSDNAKFAFPEPRVGLTNTSGVCQNLARIVGLGKAMEMLCSGVTIDAQEAYRIGMVSKVVPLKDLMAEAIKSANEVKKCSPVAVRIAKETTNACIDIDMNSALFYEVEAITVAKASEDSKEGLNAFVQKRKPVWTGR